MHDRVTFRNRWLSGVSRNRWLSRVSEQIAALSVGVLVCPAILCWLQGNQQILAWPLGMWICRSESGSAETREKQQILRKCPAVGPAVALYCSSLYLGFSGVWHYFNSPGTQLVPMRWTASRLR